MFLFFSVIDDSALCLLHLLLLAELFANTSSRPTRSTSLCHVFQPMTRQLDSLLNLSKKLHDLVRFHSVPQLFECIYFVFKPVMRDLSPSCGNGSNYTLLFITAAPVQERLRYKHFYVLNILEYRILMQRILHSPSRTMSD